QVARELGVEYVLEGSVRKAGDRVRVTVQLIDAQTDRHVWAERYDRKLEDIFAIQDEVTGAIVSTLPGRVEAATQERAKRQRTDNMAAYHQGRAVALNPNYDLVVVQQVEFLTWLGRPEEGIDWIRKAMRLNPYHPERFWSHLGRACYCAEKFAEAAEAFARITRPDYTHHAFLAATFAQMGNPVAAAAHAAE